MKQILVLFATVLILIPEVYAQDDKLIDGIKFRVGNYTTSDKFELGSHEIASKNVNINAERNPIGAGKYKFPLTIRFPENLMTSWSFRQAYLDFSINDKKENIPPKSRPGRTKQIEAHGTGPTLNLVQKTETRSYLKENFLPKFLSPSQISNLPTDWAISYDIERTHIALGYMVGVFFPVFEKSRLFKLGIGIGIGRADNKISIKLCDMYTVTLNYEKKDDGKKALVPPHEGKCVNSNRLTYINFVEGSFSMAGHLTIWERVSKDSVWALIALDYTSILSVGSNKSLETESGEKAKFSTESIAYDIFSYTYRF